MEMVSQTSHKTTHKHTPFKQPLPSSTWISQCPAGFIFPPSFGPYLCILSKQTKTFHIMSLPHLLSVSLQYSTTFIKVTLRHRLSHMFSCSFKSTQATKRDCGLTCSVQKPAVDARRPLRKAPVDGHAC